MTQTEYYTTLLKYVLIYGGIFIGILLTMFMVYVVAILTPRD